MSISLKYYPLCAPFCRTFIIKHGWLIWLAALSPVILQGNAEHSVSIVT